MDGQTAIRRGRYKLALNGRLVEGEEQRAPAFLSDLETDPGERENLAEAMLDLAASMKEEALVWRAKMESNWETEFADNYRNLA